MEYKQTIAESGPSREPSPVLRLGPVTSIHKQRRARNVRTKSSSIVMFMIMHLSVPLIRQRRVIGKERFVDMQYTIRDGFGTVPNPKTRGSISRGKSMP